MKKIRSAHMMAISSLLLLTACGQTQSITSAQPKEDRAIAFPGAEGFGKYTTGGRGGKVFIVSNLDDSGPGSFREAMEASMPRIVVFAISGTIHLQSKISIKKDVTVAGHTAPGDGICIADQPVLLSGDNIIIRYLRFRMGDRLQRGGMVDGNGGDDAFGGNRKKNIIIDHCTMSWSTDECFTVYGGDSTTLQWNLMSEPLNYSYHFETGDKDYEHHGYGGIWGGPNMTAHHNLFAHCISRTPRFNGTRLGSPPDFVDFRNNVMYNWGGNNIYGGEGGLYNMVNNYYKYGPSTNRNVRFRIVNPSRQENPAIGFGKYYVTGNYVDGAADITKNNWAGIHMGNKGTDEDKRTAVVDKPFSAVMIPDVSATQAYKEVLDKAGCSLPFRDTLDQRIINDVINRTGGFIDVQGGFPHGTDYEKTTGAWPALRSTPAPADADKDGIPDEWEKKNGLDAANAADAITYQLDKKYTNVEVYINSLIR